MYYRPILYNMDCIDAMQSFNDKSIDCIITDPPYNIGNFMLSRNSNMVKMRKNAFAYAGWDNMKYIDWINQMDKFLSECHRVLKKRGTLILFMSIIKIESMIKLAEKNKFYYKTTGIWHKTNPMPRNMNLQFVNSLECWMYLINEGTSGTFNSNGKVIHDFLESSVCPISEKKFGRHPTQKPLAIMKKLIEYTTDEGDVVLDPFMGSGSTCVACTMMHRQSIGIEINEQYYDIATKRVQSIWDNYENS